MRAPSSLLAVASAALAVTAVVLAVGLAHSAQATTVALPPVNGQFDYQIGGAYPPSASVSIVDRDRKANPAPGKYNICYVNAFQSQPDEGSFWKTKHPDLLVKNDNGGFLVDPGWPDEYLFDTSTAENRAAIAQIVNGWIDGCSAKGFQAIEADNLDSWSRSLDNMSQPDNVALAKLLTVHAHSKGLAIGQKNNAEVASIGRSKIGFDFAMAEECQLYSECGRYTRGYGNNVIEIEYTDNDRSAYTKACATQGKNISVILRDRDVVAKGQSAYRYEYC